MVFQKVLLFEGAELRKEAKTEKDVTKAVAVTEEKDVLVQKTEITVASNPDQQRKEEASSMP